MSGTLGLFGEVEEERVANGGPRSRDGGRMNWRLFMDQFIKDFPDGIRRQCEVQMKVVMME